MCSDSRDAKVRRAPLPPSTRKEVTVPDELSGGVKWLTWKADAPIVGPRVWMCRQCKKGLRPGTNCNGIMTV